MHKFDQICSFPVSAKESNIPHRHKRGKRDLSRTEMISNKDYLHRIFILQLLSEFLRLAANPEEHFTPASKPKAVLRPEDIGKQDKSQDKTGFGISLYRDAIGCLCKTKTEPSWVRGLPRPALPPAVLACQKQAGETYENYMKTIPRTSR